MNSPIQAATLTLVESLKRMEEKTKNDLTNKQKELARLNQLLQRESTTSARRTKILRLIASMEREVRQADAWLNTVLAQLRAEMEPASAE